MAEINEIQVGQEVFNIGGSGGGVNYSTTEQDTGLKWIDGKNVYQRVFSYSAEMTGNTWYDTTLQNSYYDTLISCTGIATGSSGNTFPLMALKSGSNIIKIMHNRPSNTMIINFFVMLYTKN